MARVVALEAWCEELTEDAYLARLGVRALWRPEVQAELATFRRAAHCDVHEVAVLDDGRRVLLHDDRGFSVGPSTPSDPWAFLTAADLERSARGVVLPDEDDGEEHPWDWLVGLLADRGVTASADELRHVPYRVVLGPLLRARLSARGR